MGLFGKSEAELKEVAAALNARETDLDNRDSDINSKETNLAHDRTLLATDRSRFETERSDHATEIKRIADAIAAANADLERRRSEIALMEASAKANFAEAQRESFKEVVEKRQAELDGRQKDLDARAAAVAKKLEALHAAEGELAKRELAVTAREQKADAGFADTARALADEAARQHRANLAESERLEKLAAQFSIDHQALAEKKNELTQRERAVIVAEQSRDQGFADERAAIDAEFRDKRARMEAEIVSTREQKLSALDEEMAKLKAGRLENVSQAEQSERDRIRAEIAKERDAWTRQQEDTRRQLETERTELEKQKGAVSSLQNEFQVRTDGLEAAERILERKDQRLERQWAKRNDELDQEVESQLAERRKTLEDKNARVEGELADLREYLRSREERLVAFEHLEQQLQGKDPNQFIGEINRKREEVKRIQEESATLRTEEMRVLELELRNNKARADELAQRVAANEADIAVVSDLRRKNKELAESNASHSRLAENCKAETERLTAELTRLRAVYQRPAEVAARYKEIEMPHIKADKFKQPTKDDDLDENTWLAQIGNACDRYGVHFHPRILKAFHTALKTAEWSPITILAGVSGTGKSELPRLYSHFGGLMFESLSVQPNWDSQESMLGFFNSIDNKFAAKPVLNFLAQSQQSGNETFEKRIERWKKMAPDQLSLDPSKEDDRKLIEALQQSDYPGLKEYVCMILLDEMNIAYPELYFAEFLSKLEQRRGKRADVPYLPVEIGAGMPHYKLPLGRNVLWTGTMNQDETTKSLSDKVLDRSIIIYFPRPTKLQRRPKLKPLDENNRGIPLHRASWWNWLSLVPDPDNPKLQIPGSDLDETIIAPFKDFLDTMNSHLGGVGRALGHRIWQSVEYYMVNYPDVRAARKANDNDELKKAMHDAFEDQLVQKVMPKLRGIDTLDRSEGGKCLEKILDQINRGIDDKPFNLEDDFNLARKLGYGQFIWQSANYLKEDVEILESSASNSGIIATDSATALPSSSVSNSNQKSEPPSWFRPDDSKRREYWERKPKEEQDRVIAEYNKRKQ